MAATTVPAGQQLACLLNDLSLFRFKPGLRSRQEEQVAGVRVDSVNGNLRRQAQAAHGGYLIPVPAAQGYCIVQAGCFQEPAGMELGKDIGRLPVRHGILDIEVNDRNN